jgi:hypothetical protein
MTNASPVESLESRRHMSVGPVVAQHFIGTQEAVSAVVLTFDVPLDPTAAQNVSAYKLVRKSKSSGDIEFGFGGIGQGEDKTDISRIPIDTATYDPAANTVTLTPRHAFELRKNFTVVQIFGRGKNPLRTADGQIFDGNNKGGPGGDLFLRYKARANKVFKFKESDGDIASLRVTGGGHMLFFLPIAGKSSPAIFMRESNPAESVLTGTVKQGKRGDGVVDIAQISAASTANISAVQSDPHFRIGVVTP